MADRITGRGFASRSEVIAPRAMAATSQPLATQVALQIMREGGTAVDGAIAANACLGLMEPVGCGIGGDLFAIVWDATEQRLVGLNASGRSAKGFSRKEVWDRVSGEGLKGLPLLGPLSVSVPGAVSGWEMLRERFGKLTLSEVLAPAIEYAERGHPVSELIAHYWERSMRSLGEYPGFLDTFSVDARRAPLKGELWKNPDLARSYRRIAAEGSEVFYKGEMGREMADWLERQGSLLRFEDFADHRAEWVDPVSTNYRGYDVWELPPSGQGIAALQMLNILEGYDLAGMGEGSIEYLHTFIEAKKLAYEDRAALYGDPSFGEVPVERLISKAYAGRRRELIDSGRAALEFAADPEFFRRGDTVYLCTADEAGNMVSLIQSNYCGMGSGMCPPGFGFGFQNRGMAFNFEDGHANVYEPGKRPFHTIIPAFVTKDELPLMAFGLMGGDMQPQGHAQIVCNMVDFGMNLQEAGDAPRVYHTGSSTPEGGVMRDGGWVSLENGISAEVVRGLQLRGHRIRENLGAFGGYQAIWRDLESGVYRGASESRKDGQAAGY